MNLYQGINLLSRNQKKAVQQEWHIFITKNIAFICVSLLAIISLTLVFSTILLDNQAENLDSQIENERAIKEDSRLSTINDATNELNATIDLVRTIQGTHIDWTDFLVTFATLIPDGVEIQSVSTAQINTMISIGGTATTRETYQQLLQRLEADPLFINVSSPISNLVQRENITFTIAAQIEPDELYE